MPHRTKIIAMVMAGALALVGCGDDGDTAADNVGQETQEAAQDARTAARDVWASFRTDVERLVDEIRTQDAPRVKEELLQRCRDALERLRQAGSDQVDRVEQLCDRVQETDVGNTSAWNDIRREIEQLNPVP